MSCKHLYKWIFSCGKAMPLRTSTERLPSGLSQISLRMGPKESQWSTDSRVKDCSSSQLIPKKRDGCQRHQIP